MTNLTVETRFVLTNKESVVKLLAENGFAPDPLMFITDIYYGNAKDLNPDKHTFDVTGKTLRLRIHSTKKFNDPDAGIVIELKESAKKDKSGHPSHEFVKTTTLFEGALKDKNKIDEYTRKYDMEYIVLELKKERTVYKKDAVVINLDVIPGGVSICEILEKANSEKSYSKIKKKQLDLCSILSVSKSSIFTDSYNHRAITMRLKNEPDFKLKLLEEELKKLTKRLREIEKESGEAYQDDFGNQLHDNARYEMLYNQIKIYNEQIIGVKKELIDIKKKASKN